MKKNKYFKHIMCLISILSMLLSLFGCGVIEGNIIEGNNTENIIESDEKNSIENNNDDIIKNTENNNDDIIKNTESNIESDTENITESNVNTHTEKTTNNKNYQIIKTENGYRLVFDDTSAFKEDNIDVVGFIVNSWEEVSNKLLKGELSNYEKDSIYWSLPKDDGGVIILNPYVSYKVTHPIPHKTDTKTWFYGSSFSIGLEFEEYYKELVSVAILERYIFMLEYDRNFADIDPQEKNIEYEKELSDGSVMICSNRTVETVKNRTTEKYILSNEKKTIFVKKTYHNDEDPNLPQSIYLLGVIDGDKYFDINNIFEIPQILNKEITEDLNDEFLFGFGIEIEERTVE